jgi:pimeloyl-ACP methyl ester carboxylesterase
VRYDARGHARSGAPREPAAYRPEAFVADVGRVLDEVGAPRAVVGGVSMGAAVTLRFALERPARVRGLVLASYPAPGGVGSLAEPFATALERDGIEAAGARFVWGPWSGLDPEAARFVRQGFLEHPPYGLAHTLRELLAALPAVDALVPRLRTLDVPALVVAGSEDRGALPVAHALAEALPRARLVVLADAGHVVNLSRPAAFNAALAEFLAGLDAA